jgi:hypothetical protein
MPVSHIAFVSQFFLFPIFAVPKFAVHENGNFKPPESQVGSAENGLVVLAITVSSRKQRFG